MPTVNLYFNQDSRAEKSFWKVRDRLIPELKTLVASELSCGDRMLQPSEISVRWMSGHGDGMIAQLEVDITAHAYPERVQRSDDVCLAIRKFLLNKVPGLADARVWLSLTELGHSWEN